MFRIIKWLLAGGVALLVLVAVAALLFPDERFTRQDRAKLDVQNMVRALELYRKRHGRFPTQDEGLGELVRSGELDQFPRDPWGRPYHYEMRDGGPLVFTYGRDNLPGGAGVDADVPPSTRDGRYSSNGQ